MEKKELEIPQQLSHEEMYLLEKEALTPIFCKPKLIPLKTVTTQKLEKMRKEQMEKLQPAQETSSGATKADGETKEKEANASSSKSTDVWTADD